MCICLQTSACALNPYVLLHQSTWKGFGPQSQLKILAITLKLPMHTSTSIKEQETSKNHMWVAIEKWQCMKVENYTYRIIKQ